MERRLPTAATRQPALFVPHGAPAYVREFADWVWAHLLSRDVALGAAGEDFDAERLPAGIDDYVLAMDAYSFSKRPPGH